MSLSISFSLLYLFLSLYRYSIGDALKGERRGRGEKVNVTDISFSITLYFITPLPFSNTLLHGIFSYIP